MTQDEIDTLTQDYDDFLYKIALNYDVNYAALSVIIMSRMVSLAQICQQQNVLLHLLPHLENKLRGEPDGRLRH